MAPSPTRRAAPDSEIQPGHEAASASERPTHSDEQPGAWADHRWLKWRAWITPGTWPARLAAIFAWLGLMVTTHWPGIRAPLGANYLVEIDKVYHTTSFAVLTALAMFARPLGKNRSVHLNRLLVVLVLGSYAVFDEVSQAWFNRVTDRGDLIADGLGILSVYLIASQPTGLTRRPRWLTNLARAVWLPLVPSTVMVALMPGANHLIEPLVPQAIAQRLGDSGLHFWFSLTFTWLLAASAPLSRSKAKLGSAVTLVLMLVAAPILEWVQSYTGRDVQMVDEAAHYQGLILACSAWAFLTALSPLWIGRPTLSPTSSTPHPTPPTPEPLDTPDTPGLTPRRSGSDPQGPLQTTEVTAPSSSTVLANAEDANNAHDIDEEQSSTHFVGHAVLISVLTLVSRLTGLLRDATLAAIFGLGVVADAFFVGFLIPNLFRRLFGEGALAAAFIPNYTQLLKQDRDLARRFASLCVALLVVVLSAITLIGQGVLWWILSGQSMFAALSERGELAVRLAMVMLPYAPMVCLVALLGGLLQVHRRFGPPAAAPILLNLIMIGFTIWASLGLSGEASIQRVALITAGSVLVAGLIQLGFVVIVTQRVTRLTWRLSGAWPSLRRMLIMMGPMVIGLAAFQLNAMLDVIIALWLSPGSGASGAGPATQNPQMFNTLGIHYLGMSVQYPMQLGDIAALQWAQRLYQFPLGVFGIAIATAIFPALAAAVRQRNENDSPGRPDSAGPVPSGSLAQSSSSLGLSKTQIQPTADFARILRRGLRLTMFIGLPASVGLLLVRMPLVRVIYERLAFSIDDAARVAHILSGYAIAVWAYSLTHVLTRAFYALKDTATPVKVSLVMVMVNFALNMSLVWHFGALGLALATAITAMAQAGVLMGLIRGHVAHPIDGQVLRSWLRTAGGVVLMTIGLLPALVMFNPRNMPWDQAAIMLGIMVVVGLIIVLGAAAIMKSPELRWLIRRGELD